MKIELISKLQTERIIKKEIKDKFEHLRNLIDKLTKNQDKFREELITLKYRVKGIKLKVDDSTEEK